MDAKIDTELAKVDLDYAVNAYDVRPGKTLVVPTGEFEIVEVVPHLNKFVCSKDGREYSFPLGQIMGNVNSGRVSIK